MTRRTLTPDARRYADLGERLRRRFGGVLYPLRLDFTNPQGGPGWLGVACDVQDPARARGTVAETLRRREDAPMLRLLLPDPDGVLPAVGATCEFDSGVLRVEQWTQDATYTGQRVGVCRYVAGAV